MSLCDELRISISCWPLCCFLQEGFRPASSKLYNILSQQSGVVNQGFAQASNFTGKRVRPNLGKQECLKLPKQVKKVEEQHKSLLWKESESEVVKSCLTFWEPHGLYVALFGTPWTVAYEVPPSVGFSRQEYWSGLPFLSPGDLPDPGIDPRSPALQADTLTSEPPGKPFFVESAIIMRLQQRET